MLFVSGASGDARDAFEGRPTMGYCTQCGAEVDARRVEEDISEGASEGAEASDDAAPFDDRPVHDEMAGETEESASIGPACGGDGSLKDACDAEIVTASDGDPSLADGVGTDAVDKPMAEVTMSTDSDSSMFTDVAASETAKLPKPGNDAEFGCAATNVGSVSSAGPEEVPRDKSDDGAASAETGEGSGEAAPAASLKRKPSYLVIGAAAACTLAAAVGIGLFALNGGANDTVVTAYYGSSGVTSAARSALIVPKAEDGDPLTHYYVRPKRIVGKDGKNVDVSAAPEFEVSGAGGFSIDQMLPGYPDGRYYFEIVDENGTRELSPIDYGEGGTSESIEIASDDGGDSSQAQDSSSASGQNEEPVKDDSGREPEKGTPTSNEADSGASDKNAGDNEASENDGAGSGAAGSGNDSETDDDTGQPGDIDLDTVAHDADVLFLDKLEELLERYGEPETSVYEKDNYVGYAKGVCMARFVDFGDGIDRLVVVFADKEQADASFGRSVDKVMGSYSLEVWEYDSKSDSLKLAYSGIASAVGGGVPYVDIYGSDDGVALLRVGKMENGGYTKSFLGLDADDALKDGALDLFGASDRWTSEDVYILANPASTRKDALEGEGPFGSSGVSEGFELQVHSVSKTPKTVDETHDELERRVTSEKKSAASSYEVTLYESE